MSSGAERTLLDLALSDALRLTSSRVRVWSDTGSRLRHGRVKEVDVRIPAGGLLCFPRGLHPLHCIHSGETVVRGTKYIIRTDILFEL